MATITIRQNGDAVPRRQRVKPGELVQWNSQRNLEWHVTFGKNTPLDCSDPIHVPASGPSRDCRVQVTSGTFAYAVDPPFADAGSQPRARESGPAHPPLVGPELIVEGRANPRFLQFGIAAALIALGLWIFREQLRSNESHR